MRSLKLVVASVLALALAVPMPLAAQQPVVFYQTVDSVAGFASATTGDTSCVLTKYVGTTVGKPTVEVAAGGDVTFKIAGAADTTTGSPLLNGVFDLSTPAAAVDTMGEFVSLVNTTGSNWRAVLVSCLAADLTDNAIDTLAVTDASGPKGAALFRDAAVASAAATFSAQVALLPTDAASNIAFFLNTSVGPTGAKVNKNSFAKHQTFVQHIREKITSLGTIGLFAVLAVKREYDSNGNVTDTVRTLYSETGAATTVEKTLNFHNGPVATAIGELVVVRQRTGTDLTVLSLNGSGYAVVRP